MGGIHYDWSSNEGLNQLTGLAYCNRTLFPRVSILQNLYHWCCLLLLKEIDDANKVIEVLEPRIYRSSLFPRFANTLTLPAPTQQVHWSMSRDQVAEKDCAAEAD